ncbi:class V aminotransferase [Brevundimonas aveniformis]|uniref:kynureninase/PvdN C-terminal domain-containing protein n=1 Tax=Brevundimonas aveniformis TaxID=370977 RepID=UPI00040026B7|nr:class V aminotransferase [Brevundimonas aveniformis]
MTFKPLFSRALGLAPNRLHFAAHSHHLWPDASYAAQGLAWDDAMRHADEKWRPIFETVIPRAQGHIARELGLPDPNSLVFSSNTHDFLIRLFSGIERRPVRILATDGEFHSFRRQSERWEEAGLAEVVRVPVEPFDTFADRFVEAARTGRFNWILVSQVFFRTGQTFDRIEDLAALADPAGPWVVIDGYHGFMATPTDLSRVADKVFYLAGGYKYAMSGEGVCFLHAPDGYCPRPVTTGWYAEFGNLAGPPNGVKYRLDAGRFWGATFDVSGLYRFNAVRRMLDDHALTTETVSDHATRLMRLFQTAVTSGQAGALTRADLLNPVEGDGPRARFLAFQHPEAQGWQQALISADVVTDVRADTIRFGFGLYQDEADVMELIRRCARALPL